jgi:hypothetical protein
MNNPSLPEPPWQRLQAAIGSCSGALFYSLPTCKHSCARLNTVVIPVTLANNGRRFAGAHAIAFAERSSCASCWTSPSDFISTCRCSIRSVKDAADHWHAPTLKISFKASAKARKQHVPHDNWDDLPKEADFDGYRQAELRTCWYSACKVTLRIPSPNTKNGR